MRYSTFKYGTDVKYGVGVTTGNLLWSFIVLWDGTWWGPNEAHGRMTNLTVRRGRQNMLAAGGKGYGAFGVGEVTATFDNEDGRFDPFNTDSPLSPNVTPGKFARISVRDDSTGIDYGIMRGIIADIQPVKQGNKDAVHIVVNDGMQWLKDRIVSVGLQQNMDKSDAPGLIVDRADWPSAEWPKSIVADATNYEDWWAWNQGGFEALDEWNRAEWAVAFHSRTGTFRWMPSTYSQVNVYNIAQEEILAEIGRPQSWEVVRNIVKTYASPKITGPGGTVIWTLQTVPAILDGATFFIEPVFKYQEWQPCGGGMTFVFTVNAQADGGGADLTGSCALVEDSHVGEGARLWLTNNSGSDGFITQFYATGFPIYTPSVDIREVEDTVSKAAYGSRSLINDSRWIEDTETAQTLSTWLLTNLKDPIVLPIIQMEDRVVNQFSPDLYDKIILRVHKLKLQKVFRVGSIEHQWLSENGQSVRTTMKLEPYLIDGVDTSDGAHNGCLLSHTGAQATTSGLWKTLSFSQDLTAPGDYRQSATHVIIPGGLGGFYRVWATIRWEANATGIRRILLGGTANLALHDHPSPGNVAFTQFLQATAYYAEGATIAVVVFQNSGGALDIEHEDTPYTPMFGVQFLGAL